MSTNNSSNAGDISTTPAPKVFRRYTPWKNAASRRPSLTSFEDKRELEPQYEAHSAENSEAASADVVPVQSSESEYARPPTSPVTPKRELESQRDRAENSATPNADVVPGQPKGDTSEEGAVSRKPLRIILRVADQKMSYTTSKSEALPPNGTAPALDVAGARPHEGVRGRFVSVADAVASNMPSAADNVVEPQSLSEAQVETAGPTAINGHQGPSHATLPQTRNHPAVDYGTLREPANYPRRPLAPIPANPLPKSSRRSTPARIHPITGRPLPEPVLHPPHGMFPRDLPYNHGIQGGPSNLQLRGYAGIEDFPYTGQMISSNVHRTYREFFRYDDCSCPAGIIYSDPKNEKATGEAWLYVRNAGDVQWKRDYLAERGGMRFWIYMKDPGDEWQWEQILGGAIDARATLNLWVKRRKDMVGTTGPFCVNVRGEAVPGLVLRPKQGQ